MTDPNRTSAPFEKVSPETFSDVNRVMQDLYEVGHDQGSNPHKIHSLRQQEGLLAKSWPGSSGGYASSGYIAMPLGNAYEAMIRAEAGTAAVIDLNGEQLEVKGYVKECCTDSGSDTGLHYRTIISTTDRRIFEIDEGGDPMIEAFVTRELSDSEAAQWAAAKYEDLASCYNQPVPSLYEADEY